MKTKFWVICLLVLLASCARDINNIYTGEGEEGNKKEEIKKEDFFDFSTTRNNQIILDYGMKGEISFAFYDEYPYELVENTWELKNIDAIYAGTTGEDGRISCDVVWPASLRKVWLVTNNLIVASPIELDLSSSGSAINFNYQTYLGQIKGRSNVSRGVMNNGVHYPDGYGLLGTWAADGVPDYLLKESEKVEIPKDFLDRCSALSAFTSKMVPLLDAYPELKTSGTNDMIITKNTSLIATYFKSSAGWDDMVAYYTYQEGETVDMKTIKKTVLFPRYSGKTPVSLLNSQVQLKYWNESAGQYQEIFPAGTHIGWILLGYYNITNWPTGKPNVLRYSNPAYNNDGLQRSVMLMDTKLDNHFFMMMEDNVDARYNDVQFSITSGKESVVSPPVIPEEVEKVDTYVVKGSLAFEDNWPKKGDYDMNDVVIYFSGSMIKLKQGRNMVRSIITFTPKNNGATYTNGFGFQFDDKVSYDNIKSLKVSVNEEEKRDITFEENMEKPTLILWENTATVLKNTFKVEIEYNEGVSENNVKPPFNPFIFVNNRRHEVHLPGYKPTSKADDTLRGTENDLRVDDEGKEMYYISRDNMPFALYLMNAEFKWPTESVSITEYYPNFSSWKDSFGDSNQDWYKNPKK